MTDQGWVLNGSSKISPPKFKEHKGEGGQKGHSVAEHLSLWHDLALLLPNSKELWLPVYILNKTGPANIFPLHGDHEAMFLSENIKAVGGCGDRKKRHFL